MLGSEPRKLDGLDLRLCRLQLLGIARRDMHRTAFGRKDIGTGQTDAFGAAGDEYGLTL